MEKKKKSLFIVAVISILLSAVFVFVPREKVLISRYPNPTLAVCPVGDDCDFKNYSSFRGFPYIWNDFEKTQLPKDPSVNLDTRFFDSRETKNYTKMAVNAFIPLIIGAGVLLIVLRRSQ